MLRMLDILSKILDVIYTFLEIFCLYRYVGIFYERKKFDKLLENSKLISFGVPIVCYIVTVMLLNSIVLTSPYTIIVLVLQNIIFIWMFWECDILNAVAVSGGYFLALSISGSIEVSLMGFVGGSGLINMATEEQGIARIVYLLIFGTNWYILNTLFAAWLRKKKINAYGIKYLAYISLIGLAGFVFIMVQMLSSFNINITVTLYVFTLFIAICIFASYYVTKSRSLQIQMKTLDMQNDMLVKNYQQISDFYTMNAKLHHDMKHHMNVLYHMLGNGEEEEARQYIGSLQETIPMLSIKSWTGIDVVDVILNEMEKKAEVKGVSLNIKAHMLPLDLLFEKKDMCVLFANLLDNAVEAALSEINIIIKYVRGMLLVQIENDYQTRPILENGRLVTTKKDKSNHGFGTQNIKQVIDKYHGSIEYELFNDRFHIYIVIYE